MSPQERKAIDERAEAAALAAAAERRNRPVALVVVAALLLAVAAVYAASAAARDARARRALETAQNQRDRLVAIAADIQRVREDPSRQIDMDLYRPEGQYLTKLQEVNRQVALDTPPNLSAPRDRRFDPNSPFVRKEIDATISGASPEQGLRWLELAGEQIPGLHVIGLEVRPETNGWTFRVRLARWEATTP